jgi:hypothetical protein
MNILPKVRNEYIGVIVCVLAYMTFLVTGPVIISGIVISVIPVVLFLTSIYLLFCGFFFSTKKNYTCRLSKLLESHSSSLITWMILSFSLVGIQLVIIWGGEALSFFYMGGLLPNSDANNYYKGARRLLLDGNLSEWSSRRPFMTTYLASILTISKFSLSATIAVISAITAFSIALFATALRRTEPLAIVLWAFVLVFFFYHRLVGTTLSENLGLTFGSIAFVFLWGAANERNIRLFLLGVTFMALAQVTRSGAVFVLPALILWGTFWLASGLRTRLLVFFGGCVTVILGFLLNRLLLELGGAGGTGGFGNFSYTVYGLSVGEGGWSRIKIDHPEIVALSEPARSQGIYALALNNIINQPSRLIEALLRNLHLYTFANGGLNIITGSKAWLLVQIPTLTGVVWCVRYIKTPRYALLLFVLAGVLFSSTIITEDGGLRVFSATIPFSAAIAAVGLQFITRLRDSNNYLNEYKSRNPVLLTMFFGVVLISGIFFTILVVPLDPVARSEEKITCSPGLRAITISYPARTAIHLRKNEQEYSRYMPNIPANDFRGSLKINGRRRDWPNVDLLDIPYSMLSVGKYILLPTSLISDDPREITVCTERKGWLFIDQRLLQNPL